VAAAAAFNPANFSAASFYANIEGGVKALHLEGVYSLPFKSSAYEDPVLSNPGTVSSFGGGIGVSKSYTSAVLTAAAGYSRTNVFDNNLHVPYAQVKLDILPWHWGPGFRLGYLLEGCVYSASKLEEGITTSKPEDFRLYRAYDRYFDGAFNIEGVLINGKFLAGIVFWL
jgi:hypothetical protein